MKTALSEESVQVPSENVGPSADGFSTAPRYRSSVPSTDTYNRPAA